MLRFSSVAAFFCASVISSSLAFSSHRSFSNAIRELAENPADIEKMGDNARMLAESKFDARSMVKNYRLLFERVMDEYPRR